MQLQVTRSTSLQIPPQPSTLRRRHPILLDAIHPVLLGSIINPKRGMEDPLQLQTPQPPKSCSSPAGKSCWSLDVRVAVLLVTLAGAVILLLLYKLLQLRHRLRMARARNALEYFSFYHTATYTLKHPTPSQELPTKNGNIPETTSPVQTITTVTPITPAPPQLAAPPPSPLPPPLPPPLHPPPSLPPAVLSLPLPLPVIHTTPPSPHLSWGACSDVDVYSRIGAFRPSRLSSLSSQSTVILFEHSSL